jgi:putative toxin-antitoxin system antitoxin component (TIGR02293 family)
MPSVSEFSTQDEAVAFHRRIDRVLATLSEKEREVLTRFYVEEQSPDRICREMDLSDREFRLIKSRAKSRFWRSRSGSQIPKVAMSVQQIDHTRRDGDHSAVDRGGRGWQSAVNVARVLPVIAHAVAVFGDEKKASHWLATPLPLLGDRSPSQILEAQEGVDLIEQVLTRIEHNIPS